MRCDPLAPGNAFFYLGIGAAGVRAGLGPDEDATGLRAASLSELIGELLPLQFKLAGLDPEQLGLLLREFLLVGNLPLDGADFPGLLEEGENSEDGRNDGERGQHRGGYGCDLARQVY
jgi:hypothetical protein